MQEWIYEIVICELRMKEEMMTTIAVEERTT